MLRCKQWGFVAPANNSLKQPHLLPESYGFLSLQLFWDPGKSGISLKSCWQILYTHPPLQAPSSLSIQSIAEPNCLATSLTFTHTSPFLLWQELSSFRGKHFLKRIDPPNKAIHIKARQVNNKNRFWVVLGHLYIISIITHSIIFLYPSMICQWFTDL